MKKYITSKQIHDEAIVIDLVCPILDKKKYLKEYVKGGANVVGPTVAIDHTCKETMERIGGWYSHMQNQSNQLLHITKVEDIVQAKKENKLGVIFHFQNTQPLERDAKLVEIYYRLGVRVIALCYNTKNYIGDGCDELTDEGLSRFGKTVISEMNRVGMVVDISHTGEKTSLQAIEASTSPVILSHSNTKVVYDCVRNVSDTLIKAVANNGGVIGLNAYPGFAIDNGQPSLDNILQNADHIANLVGTDHISLGLDYYDGQSPYASDEAAMELYQDCVDRGVWNPDTYPSPPWVYPKGIETPDKLANLTQGLLQRGFSNEDVTKILGKNLMRVFKKTWK